MAKYTLDLNLERDVEAEEMGTALTEAIQTGIVAGWRVRNVFVTEKNEKDEERRAVPIALD